MLKLSRQICDAVKVLINASPPSTTLVYCVNASFSLGEFTSMKVTHFQGVGDNALWIIQCSALPHIYIRIPVTPRR